MKGSEYQKITKYKNINKNIKKIILGRSIYMFVKVHCMFNYCMEWEKKMLNRIYSTSDRGLTDACSSGR